MKFYSQDGQDKFLYENFFKNKINGYFIEVGANDGITLSNTKFFEDIGWDGICIEPIPDIFKKLINNRKCECLNIGLSNEKGETEFLILDGYTEMLSGILSKYPEEHLKRIERELKNYGGNKNITKIKIDTFNNVVNTHNIDYLSIDVEGGELDIINSIDFNKYSIDVISVENNYNNQNIIDTLINNGYNFITNIGADNIFKMI